MRGRRQRAGDGATENTQCGVDRFDGLRWQEVFTGADRSLLDDPKGGMWESATVSRNASGMILC